MSIIKSEKTTQLDIYTSLAAETLEFYERLLDDIEDETARETLAACIAEQRRLLADIHASRRARGELPQEGDPERAQLHALYVQMLKIAPQGDARIRGSLSEAATELKNNVDATLRCDLPADQTELLVAFRSSCERLIDSMQDRE